MAEMDLPHEEIQSKLRLLRRPGAGRRPRAPAAAPAQGGGEGGSPSAPFGAEALSRASPRGVPGQPLSPPGDPASPPAHHLPQSSAAPSPAGEPRAAACRRPPAEVLALAGERAVAAGAAQLPLRALGRPPPPSGELCVSSRSDAERSAGQRRSQFAQLPTASAGATAPAGGAGAWSSSAEPLRCAPGRPSSPSAESCASPAASQASESAAPSRAGARGAAGRRDEGTQYLEREELPPLAAAQEGEGFLGDVLRRLESSDDWSLQFGAIDDARRLARFAPRVLAASSQMRKLVGSIASLVESLRSSLAKNALRCMGELFAAFGKKMDPYLDAFLPVVLKRAADTNVFISEEAVATLREVCWHAGEAKALLPALAAATNRQPKVRAQGVSCLAMLAQRLRGKGSLARTSLQAIIDATGRALADASGDVRQLARVVATVLSTEAVLQEFPASVGLHAAALPGVDPLSLDVFEAGSLLQCAELSRTQALSPVRARSPRAAHVPAHGAGPRPLG